MDYLIVGLVSSIAIAAHAWIFLFVRFKILEGVLCKLLQDARATSEASGRPMAAIAADSRLPLPRVQALCRRSPRIGLKSDRAWLTAPGPG